MKEVRLAKLAILSVAFLMVLSVGVVAMPASAPTKSVAIHFVVRPPALPGLIDSALSVHATARGSAQALSGMGVDAPGFCNWPVTGSISGNTVTLSGNVDKTINPALFAGVPVSIVGVDNGRGQGDDITWTFGPVPALGGATIEIVTTGSVVISR